MTRVTDLETIDGKEWFLKCLPALETWQEGSTQYELIEIASNIIEIGAKLNDGDGRQIVSEKVKCLIEIFERLTSWYLVHLWRAFNLPCGKLSHTCGASTCNLVNLKRANFGNLPPDILKSRCVGPLSILHAQKYIFFKIKRSCSKLMTCFNSFQGASCFKSCTVPTVNARFSCGAKFHLLIYVRDLHGLPPLRVPCPRHSRYACMSSTCQES